MRHRSRESRCTDRKASGNSVRQSTIPGDIVHRTMITRAAVSYTHLSPYFASTIKNTLILSLYGLVVSFPIPIILALMLNSFRHKRYRKVIQTVTYAPNFISTVVMCGMIILFLSPSVGVINHVLEAIGIPAVNFMAKKAYWRHIYVWTGVWQSTCLLYTSHRRK